MASGPLVLASNIQPPVVEVELVPNVLPLMVNELVNAGVGAAALMVILEREGSPLSVTLLPPSRTKPDTPVTVDVPDVFPDIE